MYYFVVNWISHNKVENLLLTCWLCQSHMIYTFWEIIAGDQMCLELLVCFSVFRATNFRSDFIFKKMGQMNDSLINEI